MRHILNISYLGRETIFIKVKLLLVVPFQVLWYIYIYIYIYIYLFIFNFLNVKFLEMTFSKMYKVKKLTCLSMSKLGT